MVEPKGDGKAATAGMARILWRMVLAPIALIVAGVVGFVADVGELRSRWLTPDPHTCEPYEHELIPCMLDVQPGAYTMGAPPKERGRYRSEGPTRRVSIEYPFAVSAYEITRAQFAHFVDESGYETRGPCSTLAKGRDWGDWELRRDHNWRNPGFEQDDRHPVTCVSWHDAVAYTEWLTREKGGVYRLPSEAEWEYVARAGTTTARHWGVDAAKQCEYANGANRSMSWCYGCVCDDRHENTAPVGSYASNDWGLFDVLGNVSEWTQDCWTGDYRNAPADGSAVTRPHCELRVIRGGSRYMIPRGLRMAHRDKHTPETRNHSAGFRVVREARS